MPLPLRPDLVGVEPYGAPQIDVPVRLNTNENPFGPSPALARAIGEAVADAALTLNRYPDREALALRAGLCDYLASESGVTIDVDRVWAANGSNEVMQQVFTAFGGPGRTALGFAPTYAMYPDYARDAFTTYVNVPRRDDFSIDLDLVSEAITAHVPDILLITSPNNPTGTAIDVGTLADICRIAPGVVVVDEAYAEFRRPGSGTAMSLLAEFPRLLVTRTMSKAFALAGARVGYVAAGDPAAVDALRVVRLPYHLSTTSQVVAGVALGFADELQAQVALLRDERDTLVAWLRAEGYAVADSDANFILFGRFTDRRTVWQALLDRGVLIREIGPAGWLRVSVGTPRENEAFRTALSQVAAGDEQTGSGRDGRADQEGT